MFFRIDSSTVDFFLWVYFQAILYDKTADFTEELRDKIIRACSKVDPPRLFVSTHQNLFIY